MTSILPRPRHFFVVPILLSLLPILASAQDPNHILPGGGLASPPSYCSYTQSPVPSVSWFEHVFERKNLETGEIEKLHTKIKVTIDTNPLELGGGERGTQITYQVHAVDPATGALKEVPNLPKEIPVTKGQTNGTMVAEFVRYYDPKTGVLDPHTAGAALKGFGFSEVVNNHLRDKILGGVAPDKIKVNLVASNCEAFEKLRASGQALTGTNALFQLPSLRGLVSPNATAILLDENVLVKGCVELEIRVLDQNASLDQKYPVIQDPNKCPDPSTRSSPPLPKQPPPNCKSPPTHASQTLAKLNEWAEKHKINTKPSVIALETETQLSRSFGALKQTGGAICGAGLPSLIYIGGKLLGEHTSETIGSVVSAQTGITLGVITMGVCKTTVVGTIGIAGHYVAEAVEKRHGKNCSDLVVITTGLAIGLYAGGPIIGTIGGGFVQLSKEAWAYREEVKRSKNLYTPTAEWQCYDMILRYAGFQGWKNNKSEGPQYNYMSASGEWGDRQALYDECVNKVNAAPKDEPARSKAFDAIRQWITHSKPALDQLKSMYRQIFGMDLSDQAAAGWADVVANFGFMGLAGLIDAWVSIYNEFVEQLGRSPNADDMANWLAAFTPPPGNSPYTPPDVHSIVSRSGEASEKRKSTLENYFTSVMLRKPEPGELDSKIAAAESSKCTLNEVYGLIATDETRARSEWLRMVGRPPTGDELKKHIAGDKAPFNRAREQAIENAFVAFAGQKPTSDQLREYVDGYQYNGGSSQMTTPINEVSANLLKTYQGQRAFKRDWELLKPFHRNGAQWDGFFKDGRDVNLHEVRSTPDYESAFRAMLTDFIKNVLGREPQPGEIDRWYNLHKGTGKDSIGMPITDILNQLLKDAIGSSLCSYITICEECWDDPSDSYFTLNGGFQTCSLQNGCENFEPAAGTLTFRPLGEYLNTGTLNLGTIDLGTSLGVTSGTNFSASAGGSPLDSYDGVAATMATSRASSYGSSPMSSYNLGGGYNPQLLYNPSIPFSSGSVTSQGSYDSGSAASEGDSGSFSSDGYLHFESPSSPDRNQITGSTTLDYYYGREVIEQPSSNPGRSAADALNAY